MPDPRPSGSASSSSTARSAGSPWPGARCGSPPSSTGCWTRSRSPPARRRPTSRSSAVSGESAAGATRRWCARCGASSVTTRASRNTSSTSAASATACRRRRAPRAARERAGDAKRQTADRGGRHACPPRCGSGRALHAPPPPLRHRFRPTVAPPDSPLAGRGVPLSGQYQRAVFVPRGVSPKTVTCRPEIGAA